MSSSGAAIQTPTRVRGVRGYLFAAVVVAGFTALGVALRELLFARDLGLLLLLAVVVVAYRASLGPALAAVLLGVLAYDFCFVRPYYTLDVNHTEFFISFVAFAIVGITISGLTTRVRDNERAAHEARLIAETEKVRNALLSSVSHDLRTPLGAIMGAASTLREQQLDDDDRVEMLETIREDASYLQRLLDNLLQMTRVEGGAVALRQDWQLPEEIIGAALRRLASAIDTRELAVHVDPAVGLVRFDGMLVELALVNLLDNAVKYSDPDTGIEVSVEQRGSEIVWQVRDRGCGVPAGERLRVFEKFYRVPGRPKRGSGLGLAIARAIVESHGGRIWVEGPSDGTEGAVFGFALPRVEAPALPDEEPP